MIVKEIIFLTLALVAIVAFGCGSESPAPIATPTAISSPTPEATAAPSPIPVRETPTPLPSPTAEVLPTATPVPAPPTATPGETARRGGTLTIAGREPIAHQDVHQEFSPALSTWGPGIAYSRLLRFKSGPEVDLPSLAVECELCESWEMEDAPSTFPTPRPPMRRGGESGADRTGLTFTFRLRDDARWQNIAPASGRPLTAEDIAFSYRRQMQEGVNGSLLQFVESVEATGPDTLRITLSVPDADFLIGLADGHSKIVAPEAVALAGDLRNGPTIGSGPWILASTSETGHAFERNPDYFEEGLPFLDTLNIEIIPQSQTRIAALRARIVDMTQVEASDARALSSNNPGVLLTSFEDAGAGIEVALKTTAPPFDDVRARRAAFRAMNPWGAIEQIWQGGAYISLGAPPVSADWLLGRAELEGFLNQPDAARALLRETNAPLPVPVTITVGDFGGELMAHASRIAEEMRQVGFSPSIETVNRRVFGEEVWIGGGYQMFVGPIAPLTSPNGYLLAILHSQGRWNTTGYRDAELDRLIEAQAQEFDVAARGELAREIQRRAFDGAHRFMPAASAPIWAWWPRVQGFHPNFAGSEHAHWSRVWVRG